MSWVKQRGQEFYWTVTRLVGLSSLHEPGALKRLIEPALNYFRRPQSQYRSHYRALPEAAALQLTSLSAQFGVTKDQIALKKTIEMLVRHNDYGQAARWCAEVADLAILSEGIVDNIRKHTPSPFLRVGSGSFEYPLWTNFPIEDGGANLDDVTLPVRSSAFDVVFLQSAFEGLSEAQINRLIREASRALRPDGALVLSFGSRLQTSVSAAISDAQLKTLSSDAEKIKARFNFVPRIASNANTHDLVAAFRDR